MGPRAWWVWAHDLGAVLWLGSVFYQLLVVAPVLAGQPPLLRRRLWLQLVRRFHAVAVIAAVAVVASGIARLLALPWPLERLPATLYGRLLLAKMAGAAGMLITGGTIAFGVTAMLRDPRAMERFPAAVRWLVGLLVLEAALGTLVLWCVARIHGG
ncbi:MAG TPA: CopD family protein [Thermaerobacter sp.]